MEPPHRSAPAYPKGNLSGGEGASKNDTLRLLTVDRNHIIPVHMVAVLSRIHRNNCHTGVTLKAEKRMKKALVNHLDYR